MQRTLVVVVPAKDSDRESMAKNGKSVETILISESGEKCAFELISVTQKEGNSEAHNLIQSHGEYLAAKTKPKVVVGGVQKGKSGQNQSRQMVNRFSPLNLDENDNTSFLKRW